MKARVVLAAIGLAAAGAGAAQGDPPRAVRATEMRGQAGAALGLGSFAGTYEPDFGALSLTAHGGVLLGRGVGVGGVVQIGDGRLWWIGAGLAWW